MAWLRSLAPARFGLMLATLLLTGLLAGCTSTNVGDAPTAPPAGGSGSNESSNVVKASITHAYITAGFEEECYSTEDVCHRFDVSIDNTGSSKDFTTSYGWKGLDSSGGIRTCIKDDGPDGIAAGASGQVTLECDMPEGSVRIVKIQWEGFSGKPFSMDAPTY